MNQLVSILVPIYNVEKYIEKCACSLFEQTYDNIEYIFVDDCTPDKSVQVLKDLLEKYPNRKNSIRIIKHTQNKGLSGARNTAVDAATGEYLMFVDSDDYLDLNVVETLVHKAAICEADIVVYDMKYVYTDRSYSVSQHVRPEPEKYLKQLLTYDSSVCICGKLYKSSLLKENQIQFIEGLNFGEDYVTSPRIAYYAHHIAHCANCFYNYVQYNPSSYTNAYKSKNIDDLLKAISILLDFFQSKENSDVYESILNEAKLHNKIKMLISICLHKNKVGNRLKEVCALYNDIDVKYSNGIPSSYRLILWLAKYHLYSFLSLYIIGGYKLKQLLKKACCL